MTQWVNFLLHKNEDLSYDPQYLHKRPQMAVHVCNVSPGRQILEVFWPVGLVTAAS